MRCVAPREAPLVFSVLPPPLPPAQTIEQGDFCHNPAGHSETATPHNSKQAWPATRAQVTHLAGTEKMLDWFGMPCVTTEARSQTWMTIKGSLGSVKSH